MSKKIELCVRLRPDWWGTRRATEEDPALANAPNGWHVADGDTAYIDGDNIAVWHGRDPREIMKELK